MVIQLPMVHQNKGIDERDIMTCFYYLSNQLFVLFVVNPQFKDHYEEHGWIR